MPGGRVHAANTAALLLTVAVCASRYWTDAEMGALAAGVASGFLLTPDHDVDNGNISSAHLRRLPVIGGALAWAWWLYWQPYARLIPHRHWLSHGAVISTALRWLYVSPLAWWAVAGIPPALLAWAFVGACLADIAHALADFAS